MDMDMDMDMGGLGRLMVDLTRVGVPEQQRHPTFALTALGGARRALGGLGLAGAVEVDHHRTERRYTEVICSPSL